MRRMADVVKTSAMSLQMRSSPLLARWFVLDSMRIANRANREGMRANALALTRRCVEAISVIELSICGHPEAEATMLCWDADQLSPGKLRAWLEANVARLRRWSLDRTVAPLYTGICRCDSALCTLRFEAGAVAASFTAQRPGVGRALCVVRIYWWKFSHEATMLRRQHASRAITRFSRTRRAAC